MGPVRRGARLEGGDERESQRACPLWPRMRRACYLAQDQHAEGTDAERHGKGALPLDCHDLPLLGHEPLYGISERSSWPRYRPPRLSPAQYPAARRGAGMTPGPPPKGPEHRRRRNVPAGGEWVDLHPLDEPVLQPLPRREKGAWSARARETWETWRGDPATAQWTAADTHYALATLRLIDLNELEPRTSLASEIRLRLDGLGLTPKGKRNLRWRIAESAEVLQHSLGGSSAGARRLWIPLLTGDAVKVWTRHER